MPRLIFAAMLGLALAISLVAGSLVWHIATYSAATATVEAA